MTKFTEKYRAKKKELEKAEELARSEREERIKEERMIANEKRDKYYKSLGMEVPEYEQCANATFHLFFDDEGPTYKDQLKTAWTAFKYACLGK